MALIKMEHDIENRKYIIEISEELLEAKEGKKFFEEQLIKGIPYEILADELVRRVKRRNDERQKI